MGGQPVQRFGGETPEEKKARIARQNLIGGVLFLVLAIPAGWYLHADSQRQAQEQARALATAEMKRVKAEVERADRVAERASAVASEASRLLAGAGARLTSRQVGTTGVAVNVELDQLIPELPAREAARRVLTFAMPRIPSGTNIQVNVLSPAGLVLASDWGIGTGPDV